MNKKVVILIIVIIILLIIIVNQIDVKKIEDSGECKLTYHNSCTIVTNDATRIVYFSINKSCESTDCEGNKLDKSNCKSGEKIYFKRLSKDKYKKIKKYLNELSLKSQWIQRCDALKEMINN